ncbi:MAG TPA: efflux RND transporter periplasmic adaptor subunit, partial [Candidatus Eisenbacteria bacterium]
MRRTSWRHILAPAALASVSLLAGGCAPRGPGGFGIPVLPVETAPVVLGPVFDRFEAVGTIEAGDAITVVSEIAAQVVSLPFREGGSIERGGLIAQLDDSQLKAELARAQAEREQRKTTYERVKTIVEEAAGAPQDLDDAAAALGVAQANLDLAEARLAKTRITAPFAGILGARRVSPGAVLRPGDPITDLARIDELRVTFSVPERYMGKLQAGASVSVSTTAYPGRVITGRIDVVDPVLDPGTRSATVVARAPNPGLRFRPGMSADVSAVLSRRENALSIPSEAVFVEGDQAYVFVVNPDSTFQRAAVSLGTRQADAVEVVKGLEAGQRVVRAGHQKLVQFENFPMKPKVIPIPS